MDPPDDRIVSPRALLHVALVVFVLAWILGPPFLRDAIPIWLPFLVALGLELNFLLGALRPGRARQPDRSPQASDRERYGHPVLEEGADDEPWIDSWSVPPPRRARLRGFLAGLGLIAALALIVWFVDARSGWKGLDRENRIAATDRFSEEASAVAEKPVAVRCDESGDFVGVIQHADGAARVGGEIAYLTPAICFTLYELAFEGELRSSRTARAVAVLAHEAWHLRGVQDEGATECFALQSGVDLGQRLGLSEDRARQMMRQQLTENALRTAASLEYRVPPECREGGDLDLDPSDARFP